MPIRNSRFLDQLTFMLLGLVAIAGCSVNTPATYVSPKPPPDTGSHLILPPQVAPAPVSRAFIENRKIRLGIDLKMGGSIVYLAEMGGQNIVNNHDYGRLIQTGLYGGPIPYSVNGKNPPYVLRTLGWNPVQSGDYYNNTSKVIDYQQDSTHFYVKTRPLMWPLFGESADCIMEHWIELVDNTVRIRSRTTINRADTTQYTSRPQEAPAVYLNGPYSRIFLYEGTQPFTGDGVSELTLQNDEVHHAPECWVAMLNSQGRGVGLFQPNQPRFNVGFFGKPGSGGEFDDPTGYLSGQEQVILDHNGVYNYQYTLILGTLSDIRQFVYSQPRPPSLPDYRFAQDRQRWYYQNTVDTGLPIRGELSVRFDGDSEPIVFSPEAFWQGRDVPKLYIQAAFTTPAPTARFWWRRSGDRSVIPAPDRYIDFPIVGDGQYRTYELNLDQVPGWRDYSIIQMAILPTKPNANQTGQTIRLRSVTTTKP